ncbi:MAG: glycosyltransferase, partial [Clostridia bacterium]|nr:glycosyltransferase [Clostridia bacterium]
MGHIMPMVGICNAFEKKYGDRVEVVRSYIFSESKDKKVQKMGKQLSAHTKHTATNFISNKFEAYSYIIPSPLVLKFGKGRRVSMKEIAEMNPDLIVSSYFLPSHLAYQTNKKGWTDTLIATYTPDVYVYPAWDRHTDMYIVNNSTAYESALKGGFKEEVLRQVPFVFKNAVTDFEKTAEETKTELDLNNGKFTVLFTSGAYGAKNTKALIKKLLESNFDMNLIVICGKNQELFSEMESLRDKRAEKVNYRVVGFTDKMSEYFCASDVVVGKASVNTIFEAGYFGKPMILNAMANRLEEHAAAFCKKEGIAIKVSSPEKIAELVGKCIEDPDVLTPYVRNFDKYRSPDGGEKAADYLYELLKTKFKDLPD